MTLKYPQPPALQPSKNAGTGKAELAQVSKLSLISGTQNRVWWSIIIIPELGRESQDVPGACWQPANLVSPRTSERQSQKTRWMAHSRGMTELSSGLHVHTRERIHTCTYAKRQIGK